MNLNEWVCIAENSQSGVSTWIMDDGEHLHLEERQDIGALLDENRAIRNVTSSGWGGDGMHSVARVPLAMAHDANGLIGGAMKAGDHDFLKKKLNDSDFEYLRTKDGNL